MKLLLFYKRLAHVVWRHL